MDIRWTKILNILLLLVLGFCFNSEAKDLRPESPVGYAAPLGDQQPNLPSDNQTSPGNETDTDDPLVRGKDLVDQALIPVYDMTNFFLEDIVQPRDLNYMAERGVDFSDFDAIVDSFEEDYEEWIKYAIGYSVCAVIGVLLLVFVPLGGMIVCCCRSCCRKCGGTVDPRESSSAGCKRGCYGFFLFLFISVVLLGALAMFFTASRVHDELYGDKDVLHSIADGLDTMDDYVDETITELDSGTLGVYNETVDEVFGILDHVVMDSYDALDAAAGISENMDPLLQFTRRMDWLSSTLSEVQNDASTLQTNVTTLTAELSQLTSDIVDAIDANCSNRPDCQAVRNQTLATVVDVDYTNITTGYNGLIILLDSAVAANLTGKLETGYLNFENVIKEIDAAVQGDIENARDAADDVGKTIREELDNVEDEIGGVNFTGASEDLIEVSEDDMELPAFITFWTLVGFASVLALIVLLTYLGLLCGCCPRAAPKDYCCTRKVGATFLMAGVVFTFMFFWVFMWLLLYMFLLGGLAHTEICRHVVALDTSPISGIINDLVNASFYDDTGFSINITEIYTSCKDNKAFYTALDAENTFDFSLDTLLDTEAIDEQIDKIKEINVTIQNIEILTPDTLNTLKDLGSVLHDASVETEGYLDELSKNVTTENLRELAQAVRDLGGAAFGSFADDLEQLYDNSIVPIDNQRMATHTQLAVAQTLLQTDITGIAIGLEQGQNFTNKEGDVVVEQVIVEAANEVEMIINKSVTAIDNNVRYNIGQCEPVYNAVATIADSVCVEFLYAFNGYWFAMGWSLFFLFISMILSFKLSTLYRKTLGHDDPDPVEITGRQESRRADRPRPQQGGGGGGQRGGNTSDATVLIVRSSSHEMMPINNPVYTLEGQKIPRPHLKPGVAVYPDDVTTNFVREPPRYSDPPSYSDIPKSNRRQ